MIICFYIASTVRTRSSRKTMNDVATTGHNEISSNSMMPMADRKGTGASRKSVRSQRTIATATTDMSTTSSKSN
jgi:hypothetical protein